MRWLFNKACVVGARILNGFIIVRDTIRFMTFLLRVRRTARVLKRFERGF